ncbi:MAG: ATP-binding cassette domain-containing protein [Chitinophagaceae bacterium]|nr:ATP-binding cassette domain-containing protein [Chitinophagaceae bacterium]MCW5904069.1 ATP-binding cassette domain-containing protein [Chitinophagaceae bacterium]
MKIFLRLLSFSKPYHHYVPEYIVYIFLYIIFGLMNFSLLAPLLDVLFNNNFPVIESAPAFSMTGQFFKDYFYFILNKYIHSNGKFGVLVYVCAIIFISILLKNLFGFLSQKVLTRMRVNLLRKLRGQLFFQYSHQSLSFFHKEKKGDLLASLGSDVVEIEGSVVNSIQTIFRDPLVIISTFAMLFYISPQLTFFTLLFFPISGFIISNITTKLRKKSNESQSLIGILLNMAEEAISGIRIIKGFGAEEVVSKKFDKSNNALTKTLKSITNQKELASPISEVMGVTVVLVIIVYGGHLILEGTSGITAAAFIAYIAFYFQIIAPAKNIVTAVASLQRGLAAGERVLRIIDSRQTIVEKENAIEKNSFDNNIEFKNVSFAYNDDVVINNVSFSIDKGKTIALVGESGAGKSTLSDLIPRFYDVTNGALLIDGIDVKDLTIKSLRSQISIVSQEAILFNDTVLNNIAFGAEKIDKETAIQAAKIANAHDFISELEDGYDTTIGDRGMRLSGGQRQRLTIARAIYKNAPILILDEATSALDTESERLVQDAIDKMMKNRTSLIIAHRLSTIRHADEIIVMQKGQIAERGKHEELIAKDGMYSKLVRMQELK